MGITSIRLSTDNEEPLEVLAKKLDRSKNYLINQAIKEFVARQNMEEARWVDTQAALKSVSSGRLVAEENVNSWLESWGDDEIEAPDS